MPEPVKSVIAMEEKRKGKRGRKPKVDQTPDEAVRGWLRGYKERTGSSYRDIAAATGWSQAYIHWYLTDSKKVYDVAGVESSIKLFRQRLEERARLGEDLPYVRTTASRAIIAALNKTMKQGIMSVITCESGVGKTTSVMEFIRRNPKTAYVVPCDVSYSPQVLFKRILRLFGDYSRCTLNDGLDRAVDLFAKHANSILIVDDAHCLTNPRGPNALRTLWDHTGIGIAMIGQPELRTRILGPGNDTTAQVYSRIRQWLHVTTIKPDDVRSIVAGVRSDLDPKVADRLVRAADAYGHYRYALNLLRNALDVAKADGRDVLVEDDVVKGQRLYGRR